MSRRTRLIPDVIPFPARAADTSEVVGLLPFGGGELLVRVEARDGNGWALVIFDPATEVRLTRDLSGDLEALRRAGEIARPDPAPLRLRGPSRAR